LQNFHIFSETKFQRWVRKRLRCCSTQLFEVKKGYKMFQNRFAAAADAAHLTFGFAAAPAVQGCGEIFVEAPQIAAVADQAVGEAALSRYGEDRSSAAAA
jgi:2-polyprenyl-6-methoxyphenol hydroxylase-like FAD-dependent oxidoreductase